MENEIVKRDKYVYPDFDLSAEAKDDLNWLKAAVVFCASEGIEPRPAWMLLRELKAKLPPSDYRAFKTDLTQIIFPMLITEHGYKRSLASRDQVDAWRQIFEVEQTLAKMGYESFINSGTLLGAIREGRLLPHDDDADLGVIIPGETLDEVISNCIQLLLRLADINMISIWHVENGCKHIALNTNLQMDLFPCWKVDGDMLAYPHGRLAADKVLPLGKIDMEGHSLSIPNAAEDFLALCYGPDWRVPDDTYVYPWGRALSHFVEYNAKFDAAIAENLDEIRRRAGKT